MSKRRFRTRLVVRESTEIHRCEAWQLEQGAFCEFDGTLHQRVSAPPRSEVSLCRVETGHVSQVAMSETVVPLPDVTLIFNRSSIDSVEPVDPESEPDAIDEPVQSDAVSTIMANVLAAERMIEHSQQLERQGNRIPIHVIASDVASLTTIVRETEQLITRVLDEHRDQVEGTIENTSNVDDDFLDRLVERAHAADIGFRTEVSKLYDAKQRLGAVVEWCALQLKQITPDKDEDAQPERDGHQESTAQVETSERDVAQDRSG